LADRKQVAKQIETAAKGPKGQLRHGGHDLPEGKKGMPHYQTDGALGHSFWGTVSVASLSVAAALDSVAEYAEAVDPLTHLISGTPDFPNHERTWFGAYRQIDPNGLSYIEALREQSNELDRLSARGVFRVEGRIDSNRLKAGRQ
jgi:hypothetical protein